MLFLISFLIYQIVYFLSPVCRSRAHNSLNIAEKTVLAADALLTPGSSIILKISVFCHTHPEFPSPFG